MAWPIVVNDVAVIASDAAGPLMNSTLFCAASGATCTATPEEVEPPPPPPKPAPPGKLATPECPPGWRTGPPDFVGVGAQRSGTTWWYRLLLDHPRIELPTERGLTSLAPEKNGARIEGAMSDTNGNAPQNDLVNVTIIGQTVATENARAITQNSTAPARTASWTEETMVVAT